MSVLASKRKESKFEVITFSKDLHDMLREFMQRNFGVKDLDQFVRVRYAYGKDDVEDFEKYRYLMHTHKREIDRLATLMTSNLRAANSNYPVNMREYEYRRLSQEVAILNCEQILKELQQVVETFEVDLNVYDRYVEAIDREIGLIKKWRQSDNKIKARLQGNV